MFLEVRIPKELGNRLTKQSEQFKVKSPTRKIDVWGTPQIQKKIQKTPRESSEPRAN